MSRKTSALLLMGLCVVLAVAAAATAFWLRGVESAGEAGQDAALSDREEAEASDPSLPEDSAAGDPSESSSGGYFADAAFVGNFFIEGLDLYDYDGLLAGADFIWEEDATVFSASRLLSQVEDGDYGKVYLEFGTNELGYLYEEDDKEELRQSYANVVDALRQSCPDAVICLMAVPPVSQYKSMTSTLYTQPLVEACNGMIRDLAQEKGARYLDVYSALSDEEGYLPSDVTVDGITFTPGHYEGWFGLLADERIGA